MIFMYEDIRTGKRYAGKIVPKTSPEPVILFNVDSAYLLHGIDFVPLGRNVLLILPLALGPLSEFDIEDYEKAKRIMSFILKGIRDLHRLGYTHNDIHTENVLVLDNGSIVLSDFERVEKSDNTSLDIRQVSLMYSDIMTDFLTEEQLNEHERILKEEGIESLLQKM